MGLRGRYVSGPSIQNILARNGMATMYDRLLKLEEKAVSEPIELTAEQIALIEKANPCYRERHVESSRPGELLAQDTFFAGHLKGVGKVYLQAVVDTYGSYVFGFLHTGKLPECAVAVLSSDVLPFYKDLGLEVQAILTDNGREYCGKDTHPYELYLALNDIEHRRTKVGRPRTNGFVERFNRTALDEFFRKAFPEKLYESVEALQADLDAWLVHYNTERPHRGYRNMGRRPIETINLYPGECQGRRLTVQLRGARLLAFPKARSMSSTFIISSPILAWASLSFRASGVSGRAFRASRPPSRNRLRHSCNRLTGTRTSRDACSNDSPRRSRRTTSCFRDADHRLTSPSISQPPWPHSNCLSREIGGGIPVDTPPSNPAVNLLTPGL